MRVARSIEKVNLPDGIHEGTWGGYKVEVSHNNSKIIFTTDIGVRCINTSVDVKVKDGTAFVYAK